MPIEIATPLELHAAQLVNAARADNGLDPVHVEVHLNSAAQGHSDWMAGGGGLSHRGADDSRPADRAEDADFPMAGASWQLTENVGYVSYRGTPGRGDVDNLHAALMDSESHRDNILDPDVDYVGIGLSTGQLGQHDVLFITQNFAATTRPVLVQEEADGQPVLTTYENGVPVDGTTRPVDAEDLPEDQTPPEDEAQPSTAGACFVATAAYGDAAHPDVILLRRLRDEVLVRSAAGRAFIRAYWRIGPVLARLVRARGATGRMTRLALRPVIAGAARAVAARPPRGVASPMAHRDRGTTGAMSGRK